MVARKRLRIFDELALSLDLITERSAILATSGAGKTYLERVICEECLELDQQVVVVDPKGDFHGLRSSADGKEPGYEIVIFGGEHGDLELDYQQGAFYADLVVSERISVIFDLSDLTKAKQRIFFTDFAERLYFRKRRDTDPMLLIIDEADLFAPQKPRQSSSGGASKAEMDKLIGRMLDSIEDLVRRGRKRGIGTMLSTQRSAVISKDVLDLTAVLFVLSTMGPRDLEAIDDWLAGHARKEARKAIMETIPSLEVGDVWIYSPRSLKILERAHTRQARTFDSSETPRAGRTVRKPKTVRDLDLPSLSSTMAELRERQEAEDPVRLRSQIEELERSVGILESDLENAIQTIQELEGREPENRVEAIEIPVTPDAILKENGALMQAAQNVASGAETISQIMQRLGAEIYTIETERERKLRDLHESGLEITARSAAIGDLTPSQVRIVSALEGFPEGRTLKQLATLTGIAPRGGTMGGALAELRRLELVEPGTPIKLTAQGRAIAPRSDTPRGGRALLDWWVDRLPESAGKILRFVYEQRRDLSLAEISEATGIAPRGGTMGGAMSKLRARGLIVGGSGKIRAGEQFYERTYSR